MKDLITLNPELLSSIRQILSDAHSQLTQAVNHTMVHTYWNVGRVIVEEEQKGEYRAIYGHGQIKQLAKQLQSEFGKGFTERNLSNMRAFYLAYPIWYAVRTELIGHITDFSCV